MKNEHIPPHIVSLVRRWGGLATDALLDPACNHFQIPQIEGFIGYRLKGKCAVVYGDPVCAPSDKITLAFAFRDFFKERCCNIIYMFASASFAELAQNGIAKVEIEYGEELSLNPQHNPKERQGTHGSLVRRKMRHAQKEGVAVYEYLNSCPIIEQQIEEVGSNWLKGRKGPQVHISNVHLFSNRHGKRWFYAQKGDQIIGTVVLNQLQASQGWHMNHLMITDEAPNGTPELLVISALEALQTENCHYLSCGVAACSVLGRMKGLSSLSTWFARKLYGYANKIFHLNGHKMFWGKFHPEAKPSYLLFDQPRIGLSELKAVITALNIAKKE